MKVFVVIEIQSGVLSDPQVFLKEADSAVVIIEKLADQGYIEKEPPLPENWRTNSQVRIEHAQRLYDLFHNRDPGSSDWEIKWYGIPVE